MLLLFNISLTIRSSERLVKFLDILNRAVARIAGTARVGIRGLCEELYVLLLENALQVGRDTDVLCELLDGFDGGLAVLGHRHLIDVLNTHRAGDLAVFGTRLRGIELHRRREQNRARLAVRHIVESRKSVSHRMIDAETDVRKAHAGDILTESHSRAARRLIGDGIAQRRRNKADRLEMEHIGDRAGALCDIALDRVGESVHTRKSRKALGH